MAAAGPYCVCGPRHQKAGGCDNNLLFEKIKLGAVKMVIKKEMEDESSPALAVTASLDGGGKGAGRDGALMCLWAEISTDMCMVRSDVNEKYY